MGTYANRKGVSWKFDLIFNLTQGERVGEQISRGQLGKKISTTSTAALLVLHQPEFSMKAIRVRKDPIEVTMAEAQWLFWPRAARAPYTSHQQSSHQRPPAF